MRRAPYASDAIFVGQRVTVRAHYYNPLDGAPASGLSVTYTALRPDRTTVAVRDLTEDLAEPGTYTSDLVLDMAGEWVVTTNVAAPRETPLQYRVYATPRSV